MKQEYGIQAVPNKYIRSTTTKQNHTAHFHRNNMLLLPIRELLSKCQKTSPQHGKGKANHITTERLMAKDLHPKTQDSEIMECMYYVSSLMIPY